ncbi:MAG: hypothetical protein NTW87_21600 [Planctomycetota bacterium]|nr:hypothetical protein [Planctomycetota bacterium]
MSLTKEQQAEWVTKGNAARAKLDEQSQELQDAKEDFGKLEGQLARALQSAAGKKEA